MSKIGIKAGPTTGVRLVHPLFYFLTFGGSYADPADPFAKVDSTVPAYGEVVIGVVAGAILTNKPTTTFLAALAWPSGRSNAPTRLP